MARKRTGRVLEAGGRYSLLLFMRRDPPALESAQWPAGRPQDLQRDRRPTSSVARMPDPPERLTKQSITFTPAFAMHRCATRVEPEAGTSLTGARCPAFSTGRGSPSFSRASPFADDLQPTQRLENRVPVRDLAAEIRDVPDSPRRRDGTLRPGS
jgi:hypothetical protein